MIKVVNELEIIDWSAEKILNGVSVVLPREKANTNTLYLSKDGNQWTPTTLPYHANWDDLQVSGLEFVLSDSNDASKKVCSKDGETWYDAGT